MRSPQALQADQAAMRRKWAGVTSRRKRAVMLWALARRAERWREQANQLRMRVADEDIGSVSRYVRHTDYLETHEHTPSWLILAPVS